MKIHEVAKKSAPSLRKTFDVPTLSESFEKTIEKTYVFPLVFPSNSYPLVNKHGNGKWQFIVDFPIKNCHFPLPCKRSPEGIPWFPCHFPWFPVALSRWRSFRRSRTSAASAAPRRRPCPGRRRSTRTATARRISWIAWRRSS